MRPQPIDWPVRQDRAAPVASIGIMKMFRVSALTDFCCGLRCALALCGRRGPHRLSRRDHLVALVVGCSALLFAGCGGESEVDVVPVQGSVFFDQQPAEGALVVLHPSGPSEEVEWPHGYPHGVVGQDGSFELSSPPYGVGAPVGQYKVVVTWPEPAPGADPADEEAEMVDRLEGRWANPSEPRMTAVVEGPETELPRIELH